MGILRDEFYDVIIGKKEVSKERRTVYGILVDLTDRRGFRQVWDEIDEEVQEDLIEQWIEIAESNK